MLLAVEAQTPNSIVLKSAEARLESITFELFAGVTP